MAGARQNTRENVGRVDAFSLVELMIVVTIIGFLAVIAIPMVMESRRRAQDTDFINDLRLLTGQVFDYHGFERGDFPSDAAPGVEPVGVADSLPKRFAWSERTAIGGYWDWERAPFRGQTVHGFCYAGVAVYQPERTTEEMRDIDSRIDDGNLDAGMFRRTPTGYLHMIE